MFKLYFFSLMMCVYDTAYPQLTYQVGASVGKITIDGKWDKPVWEAAKPITIENRMGDEPHFRPITEAKMLYDANNVYVIFRVQDKFVKSTVTTYNGHVSGDSCVEFFFAPNSAVPTQYFNLEINAGGTPLLFFITNPWTQFTKLPNDLIAKIEIAHSLPAVVDPEITKEITWTVECRIPLEILKQFTTVSMPQPGVTWRANFYKTGSSTSNPHYYTWSPVSNPEPNFHLPEYFGMLNFK
ncbi:carbohydrate-binding family 9-like protein [Chryseolinea sp. H1M3-3]|uniref:carbohydrate-binding family 9-like protein n=1 Tax=Chryseolinea sp. H1M3-3 TaxID=3034144 RepID=UPI0023EACEF3|nr:carbohydrate-binding family 9-like protein [Chryseolinea sp. H1M3-3]